uniref:MMS1_N domain-containing protein n=2 Tax=Macrostomum lignano TaxID=282301 RepID=A0A1I8IRE3_9PLAT
KQPQQQQQQSPPLVPPCRRCANPLPDTDNIDAADSAVFDSDEPRLRRLAPPPDRLLPGERLLHVGASSDGGAVALTNYRLLLIGACGRLSACLPAGILERPAVIADAPTAYLLNGGAAEPADSAAPTEAQPDDELADSRADAAKPGRREASR